MSRWSRVVRFAGPSAAAAMGAAAAAGIAEGAVQGAPAVVAVCAAGAAALYAAPLCLLLSLAARGLWRGWRPVLAAPDADGARILAGAVYALLAVAALGAVGYGASFLALGKGPSAELSAPLVSAALTAAAALLLAASRPSILALARAARAFGLRRPRSGFVASAGLAAVLAAAIWFGVVGPALARIDYGYAAYAWTALLALPFLHAALRRLGRARVAAAAAAALLCLALVAGTVLTRLRDPAALFDAWYRMPVGGLALGFTYDIDDLRSQSLPADLAPRPLPGAPHPDVVVISIDTVRADQLRLYGGAARTPNLARVAKRGLVFEQAFSPSNTTRQSVSSIMTGLSPARLRGRVVEFGLKLDPRHIVLAERFRAAGYATAGFLCCALHMGGRKKIGLDRGLESVAYDRNGNRLEDLASRWLRASAREPRPRYVWIHFFEPHGWAELTPAGADPRARYRRVVERADRLLAPILDAVEASGRPAFLVLASDHGEGLGDHGSLHHASDLYSSQTRVPLVIAGPGLTPGRVTEPVGLLDLAPTLLDLAGFAPPGMPDMDGRSFAEAVRGGRGAGEAYAVMVRDRSVSRSGRALIAGRFKLIAIDGRRPELYDLIADPAEARNLASAQPRVMADMTARLARRRAADEVPPF